MAVSSLLERSGVKMKLKVCGKFDYSPRMRIGDIVEADKIKIDERFATRIGVRVVGVWAEPRWFSMAWFLSEEDLRKLCLPLA